MRESTNVDDAIEGLRMIQSGVGCAYRDACECVFEVRKIPSECHRGFTFLSLMAYSCLLDAISPIFLVIDFRDAFGLGNETSCYSCCTYGTLGCTRVIR
ncbi:hypothetical protein Syun_014548 [Stephania yunnanensis]|uniref:Uncharacterized protein n=1 Tax=Stephania yunnanensis TaxID=152371 RepID=A0AAP0P8N9_9MAGN